MNPLPPAPHTRPAPGPQPIHDSVICVAAPALAVSARHGQLLGIGLDGFYQDGRRVLSRCEVRLGGVAPVPVQGTLTGADRARFVAVARTAPDLDSGWGLRSLATKAPGHNPFGHRGGAVRVHETELAVSGLAAAGYEKEAAALLRGVLDAAEAFGFRLPEMYAGEQRTAGRLPAPHLTACRPSAVAAAGAVHLLAALAGVRPDVPERIVTACPMGSAPLGAVQFTGLRVAEEPFSVRIGRLGMAVIEEAAPGLQLGV